eukprot:gnl/MRDRNA2_/MRDRNA2_32538_c0_seq1.p1 gnl/MRDRNA2_/MRDRNA2_32538_c0~~gnl/MRDRNA2_/MRDRNA2_32538_c0_seq1.p1  ORF type:complete len:595 (+),score=161.85 gnl/MRDRNA2_/MRDRNA2_32538_c0_seq1:51-1787(+)
MAKDEKKRKTRKESSKNDSSKKSQRRKDDGEIPEPIPPMGHHGGPMMMMMSPQMMGMTPGAMQPQMGAMQPQMMMAMRMRSMAMATRGKGMGMRPPMMMPGQPMPGMMGPRPGSGPIPGMMPSGQPVMGRGARRSGGLRPPVMPRANVPVNVDQADMIVDSDSDSSSSSSSSSSSGAKAPVVGEESKADPAPNTPPEDPPTAAGEVAVTGGIDGQGTGEQQQSPSPPAAATEEVVVPDGTSIVEPHDRLDMLHAEGLGAKKLQPKKTGGISFNMKGTAMAQAQAEAKVRQAVAKAAAKKANSRDAATQTVRDPLHDDGQVIVWTLRPRGMESFPHFSRHDRHEKSKKRNRGPAPTIAEDEAGDDAREAKAQKIDNKPEVEADQGKKAPASSAAHIEAVLAAAAKQVHDGPKQILASETPIRREDSDEGQIDAAPLDLQDIASQDIAVATEDSSLKVNEAEQQEAADAEGSAMVDTTPNLLELMHQQDRDDILCHVQLEMPDSCTSEAACEWWKRNTENTEMPSNFEQWVAVDEQKSQPQGNVISHASGKDPRKADLEQLKQKLQAKMGKRDPRLKASE